MSEEREYTNLEHSIYRLYQRINNSIVARLLCGEALLNEVNEWYDRATRMSSNEALDKNYLSYCNALFLKLDTIITTYNNKGKAIKALLDIFINVFGAMHINIDSSIYSNIKKCDSFMENIVTRMHEMTNKESCIKIIEEELANLVVKVEQPLKSSSAKKVEQIPIVKQTMTTSILEFNINHPTGVVGDIYVNISMVIEGFKDSNLLREVMFRNITDLCYYYIDKTMSKLQKLDMERVRKSCPNIDNVLPQFVNTYVKMDMKTFTSSFSSTSLPVIPDNNIYETCGWKILLTDRKSHKTTLSTQFKYTTDKDAIASIINEMNTTKEVYELDDLYNIYTQISSNPVNKKMFSITFGKYATADVTYRNKNIPETIEVGSLIKSIIKANTNICYYIYNGVIPSGTRDPWNKK